MGRPIRKDKFVSDFGGATAAKIAVTAYRPSGAALVSSTTAYIVSQRGSKVFKIHLEDSSEGVYQLKAVAPASLANTSNQFCVQIELDDSTVAYVEKFYNRTVHYVTAAGDAGNVPYTLGSDIGTAIAAGKGNIDIVSE
jgi:hypothetical protein